MSIFLWVYFYNYVKNDIGKFVCMKIYLIEKKMDKVIKKLEKVIWVLRV